MAVCDEVREFILGCLDPEESTRFSLDQLRNCRLVRRLFNNEMDRKSIGGNDSATKMLKKKSSSNK